MRSGSSRSELVRRSCRKPVFCLAPQAVAFAVNSHVQWIITWATRTATGRSRGAMEKRVRFRQIGTHAVKKVLFTIALRDSHRAMLFLIRAVLNLLWFSEP